MKNNFFKYFPYFLLIFTLLVILWGAWVRISGSGAGCGAHWPLCLGEIIPSTSKGATWIEWGHRLSSGLLGVFVLGFFLACSFYLPKKHILKKISFSILFFTVVEALIGALIVKSELVGLDSSLNRGIVMSFHLLNTFLLVGCIVLSILFNKKNESPKLGRFHPFIKWSFFITLISFFFICFAGAFASLANTLYPSLSLAEGLKKDFSPQSSWLLRVRIFHPLIALFFGSVIMGVLIKLRKYLDQKKKLIFPTVGLIFIQWIFGLLNLSNQFLALKLIHLLLAYGIWVHLVMIFSSQILLYRKGSNLI